jgi:hypothetical protein
MYDDWLQLSLTVITNLVVSLRWVFIPRQICRLTVTRNIRLRQLQVCWWREDGPVVYNCRWASPAQSFSGPSPVGLVTTFYCLRFETSLFVASYDSQGHDGGIRPRLHTGNCKWNTLTLISSRHGPRTENTALPLLRACLLEFPRDRYPASLLARWMLPSNGLGANHIGNTAPVLLLACLFQRVYLATEVSGSIAWTNPPWYITSIA